MYINFYTNHIDSDTYSDMLCIVQIVFEYLPTSLELFECLWKFSIPSLKLSHSFLLVGHTSEPAVNLDRAYVSFKCMRISKFFFFLIIPNINFFKLRCS